MSESRKFSLPVLGEVDRRTAIKAGTVTLGLAAWAAAIETWFEWTGELSTDDFLQKHYRELTPEQMQVILNRLTDEARKETGKQVTVKDQKPIPGVQFAYSVHAPRSCGIHPEPDGVEDHGGYLGVRPAHPDSNA